MSNFVDKTRNQLKTLLGMIFRKIYEASGNASVDKNVIDQFHKLYYDSKIFHATWTKTTWLGTPILKCPLDLWIYQELICELKPDLILETGTAAGGSALFLASMCDLVKNGKVISVDIENREDRPMHSRLTYLTGSSTDPAIVEKIKNSSIGLGTVVVILDSDHSKNHVLDEMRIYRPLVTKNSYMIVEDSNINGHPVYPDFGPGPMEAVEEFLKEASEFISDESREKFLLTFNPGGYLKKVK